MSTPSISPDIQGDPDQSTSILGSTALAQGSNPVQTSAPPQAPQAQPPAPQPKSRLQSILGAVANTVETGLSGIPQGRRPDFVSGLGSGARAEQAAQANQQAIKFKTFDDQLRMAELHNQDLKLQNDTQAQQDAHNTAELNLRQTANDMGIDFDTIANHGPAVLDHLTAQTAANGAASIPPGTHISADGDNIYMPKDNQQTRDGQKQMYSTLAPVLGLPSLPQGASFVPDKLTNMMTNKMLGHTLDGKPPNHDDLPGLIATTQAQRDTLAKNNGSSVQLKALDNVLGIYQANLDALDKHAASVKQQTKAAELAAETNPENIAGQAKLAGAKANAELPAKQALQDNAAGNKQQAAGSVVGFDPQSKERVVVNTNDPRAATLTQSGKVSSTQLDNWGTSQNQFANVQLAVSRYDQAAREFAKSGKGSDIVGINSALNKSGVGDIKIGEYGVSVPGFTSLAEASSRVANSAAFKALSPAGQDLVDKYFRMMSSIPEYQKASTGIGRTNKEMLDLELKNIPDPTMPTSVISNRLGSFQEALSSNASRVPRIQGIPHYKDVQQHYSQQTPQQATPAGASNLGKAVSGQGAMDVVNSLR